MANKQKVERELERCNIKGWEEGTRGTAITHPWGQLNHHPTSCLSLSMRLAPLLSPNIFNHNLLIIAIHQKAPPL